MLKIALEGAFTDSLKEIFFAADRVTDMEMRKQISTLSVKPEKKVDRRCLYWLWRLCQCLSD